MPRRRGPAPHNSSLLRELLPHRRQRRVEAAVPLEVGRPAGLLGDEAEPLPPPARLQDLLLVEGRPVESEATGGRVRGERERQRRPVPGDLSQEEQAPDEAQLVREGPRDGPLELEVRVREERVDEPQRRQRRPQQAEVGHEVARDAPHLPATKPAPTQHRTQAQVEAPSPALPVPDDALPDVERGPQDLQLPGGGLELVPLEAAAVELIGDRREPCRHDGLAPPDEVRIVHVGRVPDLLLVRPEGRLLVEDPAVTRRANRGHDVREDLMADPEGPGPSHGQAREGGPDRLLRQKRNVRLKLRVVGAGDAQTPLQCT